MKQKARVTKPIKKRKVMFEDSDSSVSDDDSSDDEGNRRAQLSKSYPNVRYQRVTYDANEIKDDIADQPNSVAASLVHLGVFKNYKAAVDAIRRESGALSEHERVKAAVENVVLENKYRRWSMELIENSGVERDEPGYVDYRVILEASRGCGSHGIGGYLLMGCYRNSDCLPERMGACTRNDLNNTHKDTDVKNYMRRLQIKGGAKENHCVAVQLGWMYDGATKIRVMDVLRLGHDNKPDPEWGYLRSIGQVFKVTKVRVAHSKKAKRKQDKNETMTQEQIRELKMGALTKLCEIASVLSKEDISNEKRDIFKRDLELSYANGYISHTEFDTRYAKL